MDFPPPDAPEPYTPPPEVVERCVGEAAQQYQVHPFLIYAVKEVEGGQVGTIRPNTNGTHDLGLMQLNTSNLETIQAQWPRITWKDLTYSVCINIMVGTWWLRERIDEVDGDVWRGVGNYHSRTPRHHNRYRNVVKQAYNRVVERFRSQVRAHRQR